MRDWREPRTPPPAYEGWLLDAVIVVFWAGVIGFAVRLFG